MNAIATRDLTKAYKTHLGLTAPPSLDGLNLEIGENEVFGFLGRNGAGKTTTIKLICSLLKPTRGDATVMGKNVRLSETRRLIGYLPENPYFYEYLSPRETLDFYGRLNGLNAAARAREWKKLSELLDLGAIGDKRVREFSKGMRQRLGFAVALTGDPPVLILDEPMSGLDPLGRRIIRELILRMRDEKKTIFFSSHILGDVEQVCDRVGILVKGKLKVQGQINTLLGDTLKQIEIVASGLTPSADEAICARAIRNRSSADGRHFTVDNMAIANEIVHMIQANGGTLVEFTPIKETLEDYFMRENEMTRQSLVVEENAS